LPLIYTCGAEFDKSPAKTKESSGSLFYLNLESSLNMCRATTSDATALLTTAAAKWSSRTPVVFPTLLFLSYTAGDQKAIAPRVEEQLGEIYCFLHQS
jgi:hypothetical protein